MHARLTVLSRSAYRGCRLEGAPQACNVVNAAVHSRCLLADVKVIEICSFPAS